MPPRGDVSVHKSSFAEQTLLLKVLPERIDKLAIRPDSIAKLNFSTEAGYLKKNAALNFFNYTLIHQLKGLPGYFSGKDPNKLCRGKQIRDPDWEFKQSYPNTYGYWGH